MKPNWRALLLGITGCCIIVAGLSSCGKPADNDTTTRSVSQTDLVLPECMAIDDPIPYPEFKYNCYNK